MPPKEQKIINNQIIKSLDARSKPYKFSIGRGLFLLVNPTGSKCWRMKYRIEGKEKSLTFGAWPDVTIKEAIVLRDKARVKIKDGYDPAIDKAHEREQRRQERAKQSFQLSIRALRLNHQNNQTNPIPDTRTNPGCQSILAFRRKQRCH